MNEDLITALRDIVEREDVNVEYSDDEKISAAYALNMCMVSISQIIDYDDLNILEQEYEGILNNLNLEMMPKDEALLTIIKRILDTINFFRIEEKDKQLLDKEYQNKMKNAIWSAVPNFGLIVAGGNPVSMAISLASQVGIGYMNYRRTKSENKLEYEKQQWQLQKSAMEQFHGLRRELFDTAWRLADKYKFPDEYRLTEKQISQYNDILMDSNEIRKYERLESIQNNFIAYPPFWYHFGSTANHIARNYDLLISDETREHYKLLAVSHFESYWKSNKHALLREDQLASSCALEHIDLLNIETDREQILALLNKAVSFSGKANDILQLCAVAYLRIGENDRAEELFKILVNEEYNTVVNAQILSGIYVNKALRCNDLVSRSKYEILTTRVNPDYLFSLPRIGESYVETDLEDEFAERQENLLDDKFTAVIVKYMNDFSIRLGKLIPGINANEEYPDYYYSEEGKEQRIKDFSGLFESSYKQRKRSEYLERLAQSGFVPAYFDELNRFFDEISELNCIRDRNRLEELITLKLQEESGKINDINKKIEERKIGFDDICQLIDLTSVGMFKEFLSELKEQIRISIFGMGKMMQYAAADTKLREFCTNHNLPEPDKLIEYGLESNSNKGLIKTHFGFDILGEEGKSFQKKQEKYRRVEGIIRKNIDNLSKISEKAKVYLHGSQEFMSYFDSGKLKDHKDILQNTIAVYDDCTKHNADILLTMDGIVPVIRNSIKTPISYFELAGEKQRKKIYEIAKSADYSKHPELYVFAAGVGGVGGFAALVKGGFVAADTKSVYDFVKEIQPMIDEICAALVEVLEREI